AKVGVDKELENSLLRLRGKDVDISLEASEIQVGVGLMLIQQFSGSTAVFSYASTIIRKAGFSVAIGSTLLAIFMVPKAIIAENAFAFGSNPSIDVYMRYAYAIGVGGLPWVIMSENMFQTSKMMMLKGEREGEEEGQYHKSIQALVYALH
ncbi:unnamed protein product, partial [Brassica napus]